MRLTEQQREIVDGPDSTVIGVNRAAAVITRTLKARGVDRVFGLCGGHIMPISMRFDAEGIRTVDVRDERAAVYMAHAYGKLSCKPGSRS